MLLPVMLLGASFDWFTGLSVSFVIGQSRVITLVLVLVDTHLETSL